MNGFKFSFDDLLNEIEAGYAELYANKNTEKKVSDTLTLEIPGALKESIRVKVVGTILKIAAKTKAGREIGKTYSLLDSVDPSKIEAKYEDGILYISFKEKESLETEIVVK
jgi:HSP20 family molecular chaperone IbpA